MWLERRVGANWRPVGVVVRLEGLGAPCIVAVVPAGAEMPQRVRDALIGGEQQRCLTAMD
jgi:hypothetical protein